MNRKIIGVVAAVLLATLGTFGIVRYVQTAEERALAGERTVDVFVVREPVAEGTPAEGLRTRIETERVPAKVRPANAVTDFDQLEGQVALVDLVPGEQLVTGRFGTAEAFAAQTGVDVPDGLHLVTVKLAPERVVGGQLKPGDLVGVNASFDPFDDAASDAKSPNSTHMLLHKVLVTNFVSTEATANEARAEAAAQPVAAQAEGPPVTPSGEYYVTLALDAPNVERVVFSAEFGRLWLTQEPENAPEDGTRIVTRANVYGDS